jgi:hypothetical protein
VVTGGLHKKETEIRFILIIRIGLSRVCNLIGRIGE